MKKIYRIIAVVSLSLLSFSGMAYATPAVDGTFTETEWAGTFTNGEESTSVYNEYLNPGYGGQKYDVEYLGLYINSGTVYVGLQTGFDFVSNSSEGNHTLPWWGGDLAIDVDSNGSYDYAIDLETSKLFDMRGASVLDFSTTGITDSYWRGVNYDETPNDYSESDPLEAVNGTDVGSVTSAIGSSDKGTNVGGIDTYTYEASFSLSLLEGYNFGDAMTLHWTMACGNDYLTTTQSPVPEPATMVLFGAGIVGLVGVSRRRKTKK